MALKVVLLSHSPEPERAVATAARNCYSPRDIETIDENWTEDEVEKMVGRVRDAGHLSTFEHTMFTFGVSGVSRALTHQLVRHRHMSYEQKSQRYIKVKGQFPYITPPSISARPKIKAKYEALMGQISEFYQDALAAGTPPEDARFALPNAAETQIVIRPTRARCSISSRCARAITRSGRFANSPSRCCAWPNAPRPRSSCAPAPRAFAATATSPTDLNVRATCSCAIPSPPGVPSRRRRVKRTLRPIFLALALVLGFAAWPHAAPAATAAQSYVDRRVSALPAAVLLHADPRQLIDARRQQIAGTLVIYRRVLFLFWAFSQIYAFFWVWRSGTGARIRDALKRTVPNPVLLRFLFGTALAAIAGLASIPASLARWRVAIVFDQSSQSLGQWARDGSVRLTLDALAVGLVVALVLTLVEKTRQWWIYSIVGLFAASILVGWLEPVTIAPLYNRYVPLTAANPLSSRLNALAAAAGVPGAPFYVSDVSRQSDLPSATVAGYGGTARIVLGDTLLRDVTPGEIVFQAARQLDLYRHADAARTSFVFAFLFVLSMTVGVLLTDRVRFRGDDDALSRLALVGALAGVAGLVAYPAYNGYSRHIERKADAFGLAVTGDPASAVRTFVRAADSRFVPYCTPRAIEIYFSPEPSLGTRIASATGSLNPCR